MTIVTRVGYLGVGGTVRGWIGGTGDRKSLALLLLAAACRSMAGLILSVTCTLDSFANLVGIYQ